MNATLPKFDNPLLVETEAELVLDPRQFQVREHTDELFQIDVLVHCLDPNVPLERVVGKAARLHVRQNRFEPRIWAGYCNHFELAQAERKGYSSYHMRIVPRLWFASERRNYRIFQQLSHPQIVAMLLEEWLIEACWRIDESAHPVRECRVQYGESDFAFICRLLEDAGITWYFDEASRLVLCDEPHLDTTRLVIPFVENTSAIDRGPYATDVHIGRHVRPGTYTMKDRDYRLSAGFPLSCRAQQGSELETMLERFHYVPGGFSFGAAGGETPSADDRGAFRPNQAEGQKLVATRLQAQRTGALHFGFSTNVAELAPGAVLVIEGNPHHELADGRRLLVLGSTFGGSVEGEFHHRIEAVSAEVPCRPALDTPKPKALGLESATVVGPAGEEIHCDEFGRVRVHFHWDRYSAMNEASSCWIPVSQPWAGPGFGGMNLPRMGQEVVVSFLGGDPDKPVIVGRVYTAECPVPYALPANKAHSRWKRCQYPGGEGFNELRMEDDAGKQLLYLQAERDMETLVKNDQRTLVRHDQFLTVEHDREKVVLNDERITVHHDRSARVEHDERLTVGNDRHQVVERDEAEDVGHDRNRRVGHDENLLIDNDRVVRVGHDATTSIANDLAFTVGGSTQKSVGKNESRSVGINDTVWVGANRSLTVDADHHVVVGANQATTIGAHDKTTVARTRSVEVGIAASESVGVAKKVSVGVGLMQSVGVGTYATAGMVSIDQTGMVKLIMAGKTLQLVCGAASITLEASGNVSIRGTRVDIDGQDGVKINGAKIDLN